MVNLTPKVSVIMGIYNCQDTLEESLNSIIKQTYENWEIIMCDDCSVDNTLAISKEYQTKYPDRIKVIENSKNITLGPTLNRCLELATGEYIARQDADDISEPNRIEEQISFLVKNPEVDLAGTNMISFDGSIRKGVRSLKEEPNILDFVRTGRAFSHATIVVKSNVIKALGGYSDKWYTKQAEDYELWSRFLLNGYKGINLHKDLYWVREDLNAYKRRTARRRIRGIILNLKIYRLLNAPIYAYKNILKDIIAIFIPTKVFSLYYRLNLD